MASRVMSLLTSRSGGVPSLESRRRFARAHWCVWAQITMLSAAATGVVPSGAEAHAIIVAARPAIGATVAQGQLDIRLDFNTRIDRQRSRLRLQRPDGSEALVSLAPDREPNVLSGHAEVAAGGRWKLVWQVLSVDGHITRGEVTFWVRSSP
jgi:methionine-rich copper-binding protein CopC